MQFHLCLLSLHALSCCSGGVMHFSRELKQLKVLAAFGNASAKQITGNTPPIALILCEVLLMRGLLLTIVADFSKLAEGDAADEQVRFGGAQTCG